MGTVTYEDVLRDAQQLTPEEQQRLRDALDPSQGARVVSPQELRALLASGGGRPRPLTEGERVVVLAALENMDRLAARIGAAWQDELSAVDAVKEQRRAMAELLRSRH